MTITVRSAAKINLTLDITGKRPDGYHDLRSVMQTIDLCEIVTLLQNDSGNITISCDKAGIPCDDSNIAVKCARAFFKAAGINLTGLHIDIVKNIPVQAGLAGGSADGAAVLQGLNELYGFPLTKEILYKTGASVGADIPFCLMGGTALAEGIGEKLTPLPDIPDCFFVVVKPLVGISTAQAYGAVDRTDYKSSPSTDNMLAGLDDINLIAARLYNDFEEALDIPEIKALTDSLKMYDGCLGACMSGSGSAVFAIFDDENKASLCVNEMKKLYPFAVCVKPLPRISSSKS